MLNEAIKYKRIEEQLDNENVKNKSLNRNRKVKNIIIQNYYASNLSKENMCCTCQE